jgi:hypothetical protein
MWRVIVETALLFALPFALYAAFHLVQMRWPFVAAFWTRGTVSGLAIAGLVVAIGGILFVGLSPREQGTYLPAHIENGKLAPGRFE